MLWVWRIASGGEGNVLNRCIATYYKIELVILKVEVHFGKQMFVLFVSSTGVCVGFFYSTTTKAILSGHNSRLTEPRYRKMCLSQTRRVVDVQRLAVFCFIRALQNGID